MRKLIAVFLTSLCSTAFCQVTIQKPVICDRTEDVIKVLLSQYKEKPIWTAKVTEENAMYTLFVNPKTNSWTLVQLNSTVACILGAGENSTIISDYKS